MTRTLPNRVTTHTTPTPPVAYAEAIAGAVAFLHAQLRNPDIAVGMTAAMALLDLEKTRMRHGQPIPATVPHRAAGLPAGDTATGDDNVTDSPPSVIEPELPAGKPAIFHIAAGLPAGMTMTEAQRATDSPPASFDAESPAGKPAAIWKIASGKPVDPPLPSGQTQITENPSHPHDRADSSPRESFPSCGEYRRWP